jgi:hypothetical protein
LPERRVLGGSYTGCCIGGAIEVGRIHSTTSRTRGADHNL